MIKLYGIPNCMTVKKARAWLEERKLPYAFHDYKKQGVPKQLKDWVQALGWEKLVNRQGTTWRKLDVAVQATVIDAKTAITLMQDQPSVIKRPVIEWGDQVTVGFDVSTCEDLVKTIKRN